VMVVVFVFFCVGCVFMLLIVEVLKVDGWLDVVVRMNFVELVVGVIVMVVFLFFGLVGVCFGVLFVVVVCMVYLFICVD